MPWMQNYAKGCWQFDAYWAEQPSQIPQGLRPCPFDAYRAEQSSRIPQGLRLRPKLADGQQRAAFTV